MKKLLILIVAVAVLSFNSIVYAVKNEVGSQGSGQSGQDTTTQEQQINIFPSSTRNEVQNQNEVKTQNQGEDSQLNVNTQEQESLGENQDTEGNSKEESPRSETAKENMSVVSQKVEELLTTEIAQGGIGEQVKQIAQEQKQAQNQIQTELGKVDTRSGLLKSLIGPNYQALKNMQKQMEQNQLRIQQLERLKNQLTNQGDIVIIQETIQALTDQNTSLQDRIALEERSGSLLGWLFKLFAK